ncbi:MAG: hypothetical protein JXA14_26335 [Anaerolineae bacterium]|nr:hypothetical protein [Anaerolineae bacterium]
MTSSKRDLPSAVKIGPVWYRVQTVEKLIDDGELIAGRIEASGCVIYVEETYDFQQQRVTLMHEIIHSLLNNSGRRKQADDEGLVEALGNGLTQVLVDNISFREMFDG